MRLRQVLLLVMGVTAVSFSAIFIRYADASGLVVAFWRNAFAVAIVLPLALSRRREELRGLTRREWLICLLSGVLLAVHFAVWIPSVNLTSVAASVVLVTTSPIFVAAGARLIFGDRIAPAALGGILVGLLGAAIVSGGDIHVSSRAVLGDMLALAGAAAAGAYFLAGRSVRQRVSLLAYVAVVYSTCAVVLLFVVLIAGEPLTGYDARTWWMFVLAALVPQLIGHTTFNYLLKDVDATIVAISIMGEVVGSTLLAIAFFGEIPSWTALLGGLLVMAGIYVAVTAQARVARRKDEEELVAPLE